MRLKIRGFELSVTYPALCLFSVLIILDYNYFYCITAVVFHEIGHLTAMAVLNSRISGLKISLFDIRILESSRDILSVKNDLLITSAGPAVNILLFLVVYFINTNFALINLLISAFNLLPAASLDGGQLVYLLLSRKLSAKKSAFILDIITIVISIPLFIIGILVLLNSKYNFSLLFISLYLILSLFIKEDRYL